MKTVYERRFARDLKKLRKAPQILEGIRAVILEIERAENLGVVRNVKRISGPGNYYRIRVGDYRIGFELVGDTVYLTRCLHRREIYRAFP